MGNKVGLSPYLQGFPETVGLGEGVGQSIHVGGNIQNTKRGNILVRWGMQGVQFREIVLVDTFLY